MQLAYIAPLSLLPYTLRSQYHLMLPQLVAIPVYAEMFRYLCQTEGHHVILDNGAAEGYDTPFEELLQIAMTFGVDEIVMPDIMGDSASTVRHAHSFIRGWDDKDCNMPLGIVAAGANVDEAYLTVKKVLAYYSSEISTIFIPRMLVTPSEPDVRIDLAKRFKDEFPHQDIHFLGAAPFYPGEIAYAAKSALVRGLDTSAPFNFAFQRATFGDARTAISRPTDYFHKDLHEFDLYTLEKNILQMERWTECDSVPVS